MVVRKTGNTRSLSKEVRTLVEETIVDKGLLNAFKKLGLNLEKLPAFDDIEPVTPIRPHPHEKW